MENLTTADSDAVAEAVGWDLLSMSNGRAGRQPGGYVEPTQAAWDLLEEMIATHDSRLRRLIKLGLSEPAVATAVGIGAGLYRCRGSQDSDLLVSWGPDFPLEHTLSVVQELAVAGIHRPAPLITAAPEWAGDLARVTGGDGRVTGVKNE